MDENTREALGKAMEYGRKALHLAWIPMILYLGFFLPNKRIQLLNSATINSQGHLAICIIESIKTVFMKNF
jgi:hypothetical protein